MADQEAEFGALERIMGDASAEPTRLPYSLIKSITGGFSREIGRGGFGVVYLWHKSIDVKSPQMECCIEIARKCVDTDQHKRPSIDEIIHKLNEMDTAEESRDDPGSSIHQVGGASILEELPPSMPCVDNQEGEKVKRELNKMDPTPQGPAGLKMPPPLMQPVMQPSAQRMEDPYDHSDTSDDLFDDSDDDPECFCVDDPRRVSQQWRRHNGGLVDKARPANAGGGDQDRRTNLVKGEISPISRNQPSQGKMGNITSVPTVPNHRPMVGSVPTVPNHRPMVGNGMLPEQVMMRYPNTMDIGPWSVPFPLQGGHGGEGSALSGREVLQVAAVAQNSIALQQQQHMALMRQQQHHQHQQHMAFYLLLFLFLLLLTVIVIVIVILTFKKRG